MIWVSKTIHYDLRKEITYSEAELLGDLDQTGSGALTGETLSLVDLGEHGVGGLGDEGGSETGDETGTKVDGGLETGRGGVLVDRLVDSLGNLLVNDELGHGVGDPARELAHSAIISYRFSSKRTA